KATQGPRFYNCWLGHNWNGAKNWNTAALAIRVRQEMNYGDSALLTDFYQLTMLQAYFEECMGERAVFEFFVRRLPPNRSFLVAAGLEQVLHYLEKLHFSASELAYLKSTAQFRKEFLTQLSRMRFTGDVDALPEGTVFFANEPIIQISAPIA